ncbi:MAG: hypothetical protein AAFZ49_09835 [Cyanobacteria bacterium J06659_2]
MTDPVNDIDFVDLAANLLTYYSFDRAGQSVDQLIEAWIQRYPPSWLRAAVVEALYQGRYKAVSVGQILAIWSRRGQPICHFNSEFERMVCDPLFFGVAIPSTVSLQTNAVSHRSDQLEPSNGSVQSSMMVDHANVEKSAVSNGQAMTSHIEKAERFIHGDEPMSIEKQNGSSNTFSSTIPFTLVSQNGDGKSSIAKNLPGQSSVIYPFELNGNSFQDVASGDRLELVGGLPPDSIHKFVPMTEPSTFYLRLQAMVSSEQAIATTLSHRLVSLDSLTASDFESYASSDDFSSDASDAASPTNESVDSHESRYSSHLENIQLPPQPDLEAIAEALQKEALQEDNAQHEDAPAEVFRSQTLQNGSAHTAHNGPTHHRHEQSET